MLCLFLARWHWGYDPISYASFISQTVKVDLGMLTPGKWATVAYKCRRLVSKGDKAMVPLPGLDPKGSCHSHLHRMPRLTSPEDSGRLFLCLLGTVLVTEAPSQNGL